MLADAIEASLGDGALDNFSANGMWLQMSTVGEEGNARLARLADERSVAYVDAPVLGTKQPAEQGQLIVLASGPEEVRERCETVFGARWGARRCGSARRRPEAGSSSW